MSALLSEYREWLIDLVNKNDKEIVKWLQQVKDTDFSNSTFGPIIHEAKKLMNYYLLEESERMQKALENRELIDNALFEKGCRWYV